MQNHNPHELASYLTAKYQSYTRAEVQSELQRIFNQQYKLTLTEEVEIRYREEERTDTWTDEDGNEHTDTYTVQVPYEYYILNVKMTNTPLYQNWYCNIIHHTKYQNTNRNKQSFKQNSLMTALVKRERVRYFSLPVYLTNTACGFLFAAIFVVLIVFMTDKISLYAYQLAEYLKVAPAEYDVFYIFVFTVLVTLSSTTYPSISIEGKQIEILKSLPITAKYIIKSKILLHLSVSGPIILVLNTVMAFYLHWSLEKVMLGYAMPFLYSLFIGIIGCLINIFFPNFEWENITHIIKQSLPAILSALIGTLSTCGTCYLLLKYFSNSLLLGGYIVCGIILLLISILVLCLNRRGEHLYQAL